MSAELRDLAERACAYHDLASDARKLGQLELAKHCEQLTERYSREYDDALETAELVDARSVYPEPPIDPATLTDCEACQ